MIVLEELCANMRRAASAMTSTFEGPDDYWAPVAEFYGPNGVDICELPTGRNPAQLPLYVATLIIARRAKIAAVISPAITLKLAEVKELDGLPELSDHPESKEMLVLIGVDSRMRVETWFAQVIRDGEQPPVLWEWEKREGVAEGQMASAMARALVFVNY